MVVECMNKRKHGLCRSHVVMLSSGVVSSLMLKNEWGVVVFSSELGICFPALVPSDRQMVNLPNDLMRHEGRQPRPPAAIKIYIDSSAERSFFSCSSAFILSSLKVCTAKIDKDTGAPIPQAAGTARFMVQCSGGSWVVFLVHNALLVDTHTNFLSIPQVLMEGIHQLLLTPPAHLTLDLQDSLATTRFKCPTTWGKNGLCSFQGHLVSPDDKCLSTFPVVCLTPDGVFSPPPPSLCHGPPEPES